MGDVTWSFIEQWFFFFFLPKELIRKPKENISIAYAIRKNVVVDVVSRSWSRHSLVNGVLVVKNVRAEFKPKAKAT